MRSGRGGGVCGAGGMCLEIVHRQVGSVRGLHVDTKKGLINMDTEKLSGGGQAQWPINKSLAREGILLIAMRIMDNLGLVHCPRQ